MADPADGVLGDERGAAARGAVPAARGRRGRRELVSSWIFISFFYSSYSADREFFLLLLFFFSLIIFFFFFFFWQSLFSSIFFCFTLCFFFLLLLRKTRVALRLSFSLSHLFSLSFFLFSAVARVALKEQESTLPSRGLEKKERGRRKRPREREKEGELADRRTSLRVSLSFFFRASDVQKKARFFSVSSCSGK